MGSDGSGASQVPADGWYAVLDGQQSGPMTLSVLVGAVEEGRAGPSTYVWRQGFDEWTRADEVGGLAELVASVGAASGEPTRVAPAPAESSVSDENLDDLRKTVAVDMDQVMAAAQGPEGDATTATPFSETPSEDPDASSSMDSLFSGDAAPAASDQGFFDAADSQAVDQKVMLYQRRDTSVLFSLDEFGKSGSDAGGGGGGDAFGERTPESGLIDIRSVARNRPDTGSSSALFEESKPAASSGGDSFSTRMNTQTEPLLRSRKKKGPPMWALVAGGVAVAMLGAAAAVFVVTGQKDDVAEVAPTQVAEVAPAPSSAAPAEVEAPAAAKPKVEEAPAKEAVPADAPDAVAEEATEVADAGTAPTEPDAEVPEKEKVEEPAPEPKKVVAVAAAKPKKVKKKKVVKPTPKPAKAKKPEPKPAPAPKQKEVVAPAKSKSSDKANSATALLDSLGGGGGGSKSSAPAAASSAPKKLSKSAIRKVVRKYTSKVIGCYKKSSAASEGTGLVTVTARLSVAPSGTVQSVSVVGPFGGTPVGTCISGKLKSAKFPAFGGSAQTVPMTFRVR